VLLGPVQRQVKFRQPRRGELDGLPTLQDRLDQLQAQESEANETANVAPGNAVALGQVLERSGAAGGELPVNGFITNLTLEVGQYASVGTKVMALIDSDSYRATGYFEETKIPATLGEDAKIYLLDGSAVLRGHVQSIARGITDRDNTGGLELLVNPNPTFDWVRLAQRIPVRIHIDDGPKGVLISSGMTCTVVLEVPARQ
jgi:hypothetical protein